MDLTYKSVFSGKQFDRTIEEEEELHQSSQMRLIRRNINTGIKDPSTNIGSLGSKSGDVPFIFPNVT